MKRVPYLSKLMGRFVGQAQLLVHPSCFPSFQVLSPSIRRRHPRPGRYKCLFDDCGYHACPRLSIPLPSYHPCTTLESSMPDVFFHNGTDHTVHIGVWAVTLHGYTNKLGPDQSWKIHLAGIPYTIEIRAGDDANEFSQATSNDALAKIGTAYGHGTASVLTAVGWGLGMLGIGGPVAQTTSGATTGKAFQTVNDTMSAVLKGGYEYFNDRAPGHLLTVPQISMFDFGQKNYAVRRNGNGKVQLWDTKQNCLKGEA